MAESIREKTALEIGQLIKKREISCADAAREFLEVAKADFSKQGSDTTKINAYASINEKEALSQAESVQRRIDAGETFSPLAGVPIAIKDNICTTEGTTTAASKILTGWRAPYDAAVIEKLRKAGLVMLGKTNMDEFAMGGSTETSYLGITRNPWDTSRVPGGSSGGSAAAVAARLAPLALGSDTGGSIRQPCAFTNLTGMKPTYGSVSRYGLLAYGSSLDQIGPLAKDAKDAAALLSLIAGKDERDSTSREGTPKTLKKTIGIPKNYFETAGMSPEVKARIYEAAAVFRSLGAEVREFELPLIDYAVPTYLIIACAEASSNLSRYDGVKYAYRSENADNIKDIYYKTRSEGFGTEVKRRIILGSFVLSSGYFDAYYKKALKVRQLIKNAFADALKTFDVILAPVCPTAAYEIGGQIKDPLAMYLGDIFTTSVNLTGLPAAALPCGFTESGLPLGMQLIGAEWTDAALLTAAAAYQEKTNWHKMRPRGIA